jgi:hypothetical protein
MKFHKNRSSANSAFKCRHTENKQKDRRMTERRDEVNSYFLAINVNAPKNIHTVLVVNANGKILFKKISFNF